MKKKDLLKLNLMSFCLDLISMMCAKYLFLQYFISWEKLGELLLKKNKNNNNKKGALQKNKN